MNDAQNKVFHQILIYEVFVAEIKLSPVKYSNFE